MGTETLQANWSYNNGLDFGRKFHLDTITSNHNNTKNLVSMARMSKV